MLLSEVIQYVEDVLCRHKIAVKPGVEEKSCRSETYVRHFAAGTGNCRKGTDTPAEVRHRLTKCGGGLLGQGDDLSSRFCGCRRASVAIAPSVRADQGRSQVHPDIGLRRFTMAPPRGTLRGTTARGTPLNACDARQGPTRTRWSDKSRHAPGHPPLRTGRRAGSGCLAADIHGAFSGSEAFSSPPSSLMSSLLRWMKETGLPTVGAGVMIIGGIYIAGTGVRLFDEFWHREQVVVHTRTLAVAGGPDNPAEPILCCEGQSVLRLSVSVLWTDTLGRASPQPSPGTVLDLLVKSCATPVHEDKLVKLVPAAYGYWFRRPDPGDEVLLFCDQPATASDCRVVCNLAATSPPWTR